MERRGGKERTRGERKRRMGGMGNGGERGKLGE